MTLESSEATDAALNRIADCLTKIADTIEEYRIEFSWLVRNLDAVGPVVRQTNGVPEVLACASCDADSPDSLAAALQEGWTRLQRDEAEGWSYLGLCPACQEQELAEERAEEAAFQKQVPESERAAFIAEFKRKSDEATEPHSQKSLFPDQSK